MRRINLLHLITVLEPAGAEKLLVDITRKLDKSKFNLTVAYIYGPGTLAKEIRKVKVGVVDLSRKGKLDPLLLIRLVLLLRRKKIRILHTHLLHASIVGRIAAKLAGITNIITTRHYSYYHKEKSLVSRIERKTAIFNSDFIAISSDVKKYMRGKEKYRSEKIVVLHNAVDLSLFNSVDRLGISKPQDDLVVGSIGRLHPSKGYETLLRSMSYVIEKLPTVKLVIIGTGREKNNLEKLSAQLGVFDNVTFLGRKQPLEIPGLLKTFNLFVLASNWEGFGLAVVEAMASGLPVVATNVGGLPEIVEDGQTGFLVPSRKPRVLAEKIIHLLQNPDLCLKMGKQGRRRVESLFSLDGMIKELEYLYLDMLKREMNRKKLNPRMP